jgi:hypothetical protein
MSEWTKKKGYAEDSIENWAIWFIDSGNSFSNVLEALTNGHHIYNHPDCPKFDKTAVETAIRAMIADETLACGPAHGWDEYLVVREWMPRMAATLMASR